MVNVSEMTAARVPSRFYYEWIGGRTDIGIATREDVLVILRIICEIANGQPSK
jgi:hypothetical protein